LKKLEGAANKFMEKKKKKKKKKALKVQKEINHHGDARHSLVGFETGGSV